MGAVYLITNIANGNVYVGSSLTPQRRWSQHKTSLRGGKHHSPVLQRAWDKYGENSFRFEIIEDVPNPLHLTAVEQVYINFFKPVYNVCLTAGSRLGMAHKQETKQKIRESLTGKKLSKETREKMSMVRKGRKAAPRTHEHQARLNAARARQVFAPRSLESRERSRQAQLRRQSQVT